MNKKQKKAKLSTRETILHSIKTLQQATIDELASAADISPMTVRHHLNALMAEGKVEAGTVKRAIGRPHHVYSLSAAGEELFPQKYFRLNNLLLEELKDRFDPATVSLIFSGVAKRLIDQHRDHFEGLRFEERLDFLVELLEEEGFLANWEKGPNGYILTEYGCPFISIGQTHPEICAFDKDIIFSVLNREFEQQSCMLQGDKCCHFVIPFAASN